MKRFQLFRMAAVLSVGLCWLTGDRPVIAQSGVIKDSGVIKGVTGEWHGFYTSAKAQDQGIIHGVTVAIDTQTHRRFAGWLALGDFWYEIHGTVAASGNVNITGKGTGGKLNANFELHDFGGGAAVVDGELKIHHSDGSQDDGLVLILRSYTPVAGSPLPNVSGEYDGSSTSANTDKTTPMSASFVHDTQGAAPTTFCGDVQIIDMNYTGCGTINEKGNFLVIGLGVDGPLYLQGSFEAGPSPTLCGEYKVDLIDMNFSEDFGEFCIVDMNLQPDNPIP
jgi:hypothetical protein